ncbi:MAG: helix-turn-helix domain-containing protein [Chloroflexi bacterium]|nr:helix-turn-helix domain-containing protein [Chloroflexota bacterium]
MATETPRRLLTTKQASDMLEVDPSTIRRWAATGRIPSVELPSGRLKISKAAVEKMLEQLNDVAPRIAE